ncbi:uncharacterized protein EMH_0059040 [Eimeria mitis]|uniref:Transmembrane protein n=1 Tax=Eimeria mitis TaxID=44415 RepID=U6K0L6_9EIME|nr:uncharacterized protein EMH_0059040 [Eimeria mitis]CDJ30526.1 hypothetical protein EMH_0059040 [Eimeria mitis]
MRGRQIFFSSFSTATGCLCTLGLLSTDAEAPVSAAAHSPGIEPESHSLTSFSNNAWSTAGREREDGGTRSLFSDDSLHDASHLQDGTLVSPLGDTRHSRPGVNVLEEDRVRAGLVPLLPPAASPKSSKDGRRRLFAAVSTAFLGFALYLGLMTLRYKQVPPDSQPAGSEQTRPKQRQQDTETVTAEQLLQSVDELKNLQPLAAELAKMVGTHESRSALQELCSSLTRSQDIAQMIQVGPAVSSGSPLTAVKTAIQDSVSALSRLYEAARERGLSLTQEVQKERPPVFSEEEMQLLEDSLGTGFREFVDFREQSMKYSTPIFVQKVEKAAAELKGLRSLDCTDDLHLLVSVAKNLEIVKVAHDAMQIESEWSGEISDNAAAVLRMQYQRKQASTHLELEGQLGELHILCTLERERRQFELKEDVSVLKTLELLEEQLKRGELQLQKHENLMNRAKHAGNILSALKAEKQAVAVAESLKALLEAAASSRRSIPGVASEEEAAQSEAMQRHRTLVAYRTKQRAASHAKRAISRLKAIEMQISGDFASPSEQELKGKARPPLARHMSIKLAELVADKLKEVEDVNADLRKPVNTEEDTEEGNSSSAARTKEILRASQAAASAAVAFLHEAELMWLDARLKKSLEFDVQLSVALARKATAAVSIARGEEAQQQHDHIEMSAADIQEFEELLAQFNSGHEKAQSANGLNELASAAAGIKQVASKLTTFVEELQKQPAKR